MHNGKKFKTKCNAYGLLKLFRHTHSSYIKVCCVLVKEGFEGGGGERERGGGGRERGGTPESHSNQNVAQNL